MAMEGVTKMTLDSAWRQLCPYVVSEMDFEGLEPEADVMKEIVSLGKTMSPQVDEDDVTGQSVELTTDELKELHDQKHAEVLLEIRRDETEVGGGGVSVRTS